MLCEILRNLPEDFPWKDTIRHFPIVDSTNTLAKELAQAGAPHGTVLIADAQTGGRGRMGRSFHSPAGSGIYLSVILRPGCHASQLMHLTCATGVAICSALEAAVNVKPGIKWTNDLVYGTNKLGGILTELALEPDGTVRYAVVGVGINCTQQPGDFPEDIRNIAISLAMVTGQPISRSTVAAEMIRSLEQMSQDLLICQTSIMDVYRKNCITVGREISVNSCDSIRHGIAESICDDGGLVVRFEDGHRETIGAGEVSIRGMYGYI